MIPPVSDVTFFGPKEVSWILLLVNVPEMQKRSSRNTKMQKNKSFNSVVQPTSTSTSTNISSAFAIDVSGCAHNRHGVLNLDHHRQELSQLPSNVTLAPLPTAREAEVFSIAKNIF